MKHNIFRAFILLMCMVAFFLLTSCDVILAILFDHTPPTASIISPGEETVVSIDTGYVQFTILAQDDGQISSVLLYLDSVKIISMGEEDTVHIDSVVYYQCRLNIEPYADCLTHIIYVIAHDKGLNSVTTLPIYLTVNQPYYTETYPYVWDITPTTAKTSGMVSCDNGYPVTERGMCWSHAIDPTISDPHASSGTGLGEFDVTLSGLDPNSIYYFRTYAINEANTFYGESFKFLTPPVNIPDYEMVTVPGGNFSMGDVFDTSYSQGLPIHKVYLSKYDIGKYEVTQDLYVWVMGINPSNDLGGRLPLHDIEWFDAIKFCNAYSIAMGYDPVYTIGINSATCNYTKNGFRLPTEAEWEYAARSLGRNDRKWSGTNSSSDLGNYAWLNQTSVKQVGTKLPNELGIYDMTGNAMEWCWGNLDDYTQSIKVNPRDKTLYAGYNNVARGGYAKYNSYYIHNAWRWKRSSFSSINYYDPGFRLVKKSE